ncbi:MAG: signal peptide peptidase SppA [Cyanobacteriota bacterium]|nr:signal peptide peptidase SppA [Cyanobacteriota bacterium]
MGKFWKYTLASFTGSLLFFLLLGFWLTLGALGLAGLFTAGLLKGGGGPSLAKNTVLVYDLSAIIADAPSPLDWGEALLGGAPQTQLSLYQAVTAIRQAAEDDRIVALYLKGSDTGLGAGLANQVDLHQAIAAFKATGKPILAYDSRWSEREYYLASLADSLYLHPLGEVEMNGLYAETMYQARALDKLGVGVQVTRVGKYKSAVEPFLRDSMSPEERNQSQRLLQDVWQELIRAAAAGRSQSPEALQAIADQRGLLFGAAAQTAKLVDKLAYEDEVITALRQITDQPEDPGQDIDLPPGEDSQSFPKISLSAYAQTLTYPHGQGNPDQQIALVYAEGTIVDGQAPNPWEDAGVIAGDSLARRLRQLRQNPEIKAVVLRVNSPGGSATASEVVAREVRLLQDAGKPVVVSMGDVAASGGYWIASGADLVLAQPTTITGSIGVFSLFLNLQELGGNLGVRWDGVKTAALADMGSTTRPKPPQQLAILQGTVDRIYQIFLDRVAQGRNLPPAKVADIAQGRVWSGKTAKQLGLVDDLGGVEMALTRAATLANLGDDWQLHQYPEPDDWSRFLWNLTETLKTQVMAADPLRHQLDRFLADLTLIKTLNDPQGIYLLMPYQWDVE